MSAKRVGLGKLGYFKWWVMSDENWVRSDEWWKKKQGLDVPDDVPKTWRHETPTIYGVDD